MAALSAPGIGSGLDINGIVSKLMDLEKKPLANLQKAASTGQTKLSAYGQLKSQLSNLQDQVAKLAADANWNSVTLSSSNAGAVSGSVGATAKAASFTVQVSQLAQAQATAASVMPSGQTFGAGTLTIGLGQWSAGTFTAGTAPALAVQVAAGDTLAIVANKINQSGAGVSATVLHDSSGDRLLLKSSATGTNQGFRVQSSGAADLAALAYNPPAAGGMALTQAGVNMQGTLNGVAITSNSNSLDQALPGVSLNFHQVTTGPVQIDIKADTAGVRNSIVGLVSSFNALSNGLKEMTKYDVGTKTAGTLQGDATALGLQSILRRMLSDAGPAGTSFRRLTDIGVEFQLDGSLKINDTKLNSALNNLGDMKTFFTQGSGSAQPLGLATRLQNFVQGALKDNGTLGSRYKSLQQSLSKNAQEQSALNDRLQRNQDKLMAQYSRLDGQLSSLSALSGYVNQQITSWNNQKGN